MTDHVAVIGHDGRTWDLEEGQAIAYGRQEGRAIRIRDPRISSMAGLLYVAGGCVWIRHDSASHAITVIPQAGVTHTIPTRPAGLEMGRPQPLHGPATQLQMIGRLRTVEIQIDSSALVGPVPIEQDLDLDPSGIEPTEVIRAELTQAERTLLAALAEPLLVSGGQGRPLLTRQVAERLGTTYRSVENRLSALRLKLTGLGAPGLIRDDLLTPDTRAGSDFVSALGTQAFAHGWADRSDIPQQL